MTPARMIVLSVFFAAALAGGHAVAQKRAVITMDNGQIELAGIDLTQAGAASIARRVSVPGTIVPDSGRVAHVSVKLAGSVAELRKNIGDDVAKDEILAVLESREVADAKSEYLAARLNNELQQDLTARDKSLWEGRAVPEQQYIKSRNAAAQTEMRFSIARQKLMALGVTDGEIAVLPQAPDGTLRSQNVRAPIHGRIAERKVELGTAVGRDNLETELFVIVDLSRVWVELSVSSADLSLVKEGQSIDVALRGPSETGTGTIVFVSPLLDKDTRSARVVASLDNPKGRWRPGSFVTVAIEIEKRDAPVTVPFAAIQTVEGRKAVFVRTKDGFETREVKIGRRDGTTVEIVSGLAAGETIAASNTFSLKAEVAKPGDED
ncbi:MULTISPECIES: efflux RND transporter periplasmic adaptor subunit [unclassified Bradyrhizobium]|uniref:efflux RND transporter periplasmic adaptor subunit n=1 Tax=unclassified Bradyrhizobium TaxID=2631580 RepID=UPI0015C73764|nr:MULTISPECIES: efflux RND transporter periplasmic adaptor subunit [unclassified Bradyrhizobium]MBB4263984.1 cobalt-zinc-cadmium efflux system membrane fusion protein [Bradyrhizobium sp. CIR3A]NYG50543.1 cobalt-zinc-cadmium efflux system membrane fusion protein [Bradyrhizobium sp. IAR9]